MKLLMTADTVGGVWTYALELARALAPHGVEIALATMGKRLTPEQRAQIVQLHNVTLHESEYKLEWMENPWRDVDNAGEWLLAIERRCAPDLIHLNGYAHAAFPWRAPKVVVCHSCVLSWWLAVHCKPAPVAEWSRYRDRVRQGLLAADYVVAPTRAMLQSIEKLYGLTTHAIAVISNARELSRFTPADKTSFIFSAGRVWDPAKNIAALERIAAGLSWPVFVAGDEAQPEANSQRASRTSPLRALGFLPTERIARWMSRASIYCLPACYEPFGLSVLEAALSGCALVLGDIPSLRENWDGAAVFVDPADHQQLSMSLKQLIANENLRDKYADRARSRALQFTPTRMAAKYLSIYQSLLTRPILKGLQPMEVPACAS